MKKMKRSGGEAAGPQSAMKKGKDSSDGRSMALRKGKVMPASKYRVNPM